MPDGVLDDASFNTTTYEATLERTIGADVALDLSLDRHDESRRWKAPRHRLRTPTGGTPRYALL